MEKSTREKILDMALDMFSLYGYEATNLRDLASSLGLSKSAIYKHFSSKEEIRNLIISNAEEYYEKNVNARKNVDLDIKSKEDFFDFVIKQVEFTINDETIIKIRKLLMIDQFRDSHISNLATRHFNSGLCGVYEEIFGKLINAGLIKNVDKKMLALEFTAPISSLIHLIDREPDRKGEIFIIIKEYIKFFLNNWWKNEDSI